MRLRFSSGRAGRRVAGMLAAAAVATSAAVAVNAPSAAASPLPALVGRWQMTAALDNSTATTRMLLDLRADGTCLLTTLQYGSFRCSWDNPVSSAVTVHVPGQDNRVYAATRAYGGNQLVNGVFYAVGPSGVPYSGTWSATRRGAGGSF